VIGVQSASSPAAQDSWGVGKLQTRPNRTTVAGPATERGFALRSGGNADPHELS
jgi:threonine dehydratase